MCRPRHQETRTSCRDLCNVPLAEITVECRGAKKYARRLCDISNAPLAEVTVEGRGTTEHRRHVCNLCNVPLAEVTVERLGTNQTWLGWNRRQN